MNKTAVLLAIISAAVSVVLYRDLRSERERFHELRARVAETQRIAPTAESDHEPLRTDGSSPQRSAQAAMQENATVEPSRSPQKVSSRLIEVSPGTAMRRQDLQGLQRALANPDYRAAFLAQRRLSLEEEYPDLAAALNLQPDEMNRLLQLLANETLIDMETAVQRADKFGVEDPRRGYEERRKQIEADRLELLGEARVQQFSEYLESLVVRRRVRDLRTELAGTNFPLREDQFEPLIAALAAEQQRNASERERLNAAMYSATRQTAADRTKRMEQRFALIQQDLQRMSRTAAGQLDSEQSKRLERILDRDLQEAQLALRAWRAEQESRDSGTARR